MKDRCKTSIKEMPLKAWTDEQIMSRLRKNEIENRKCYTEGGHVSGAVYIADQKHWDFIAKVQGMFIVTNPLHMDEFKSVVQMEAEIIRMVANLYQGGPESCGIVTSGGTESIILACLAYREIAKEKGITKPNMVMSETAHAAFDKAEFYLGIELRKVPQTKDLRVDLKAMRRQIDSNTILLASSGPEYPYGNFDPLKEIAALAMKWGIGCHLDACLGSFNNAFSERAGYKLPELVDFRQPGVTSISVDPHKYAFGPKGLGVCLFRNGEIRKYQFFGTMKWNGGFYATTSLLGSRPGSVIAGTWAAMMRIGTDGYIKNTKMILDASRNIRKAIESEVPEMVLGSRHDSSVVSVLTRTDVANPINAIALADVMKSECKWWLNTVQRPAGLHIAITLATAPDWRLFIDDLKKCIALMKSKPELNHNSNVATYGIAAKVPDLTFLNNILRAHSAAVLDAL